MTERANLGFSGQESPPAAGDLRQWGPLRRAVKALDEPGRDKVLEELAAALDADGQAAHLLGQLAESTSRRERYLALWLASRPDLAVPPALLRPLRRALADERQPEELRVEAAVSLFRAAGSDAAAARGILGAVLHGQSKTQALERLRQLARLLGPSAVVDELRARLEKRRRLTCPLCPARLRRPEMGPHLWQEHGLVLDGLNVREPWRVVEKWLEAFARNGDAGLLERARSFGQRLDPAGGMQRVHRLTLSQGADNTEARLALEQEADRHGASLCPSCFASVPLGPGEPVLPLSVSPGRLAGGGYAVEVRERGWSPQLEITTPTGVVYHGPEPGRYSTRHSATLLLAGPFVLAALAAATVLPLFAVPPVTIMAVLLALAVAVYLGVRLSWRGSLLARVVEHAWDVLAPRLHAEGFSLADSTFLAGLARLGGRGSAARRWCLEEVVGRTIEAAVRGACPVSHLAALQRLAVEDRAAAGYDPVALVCDELDNCFQARLPLAYAEYLLAGWGHRCWTTLNLTRLRVLACDRAFAAGFEVRDLQALAESAPALAEVLGVRDGERLALLRLLWSLRPVRPWDQYGAAATAFELAADLRRARRTLDPYPDLLLAARGSPHVFLCARGVVYRGLLFERPPEVLEVRARWEILGPSYELAVGSGRFRFRTDPEILAVRLERWFRYYFNELMPQAVRVWSWQAPVEVEALRAGAVVRCPECGTIFQGKRGAAGVALKKRPRVVVGQDSNPDGGRVSGLES